MILTHQDYQIAYGMQREQADVISLTAKGEEATRVVAAFSSDTLDTMHRKVIWALLAMHPVVFVGFGLRDEFFMHTLRIVQQDFALSSDPVHFAIVGYSDDDEKADIAKKLQLRGVQPVFYSVPDTKASGTDPVHRGLVDLVSQLADAVDVQSKPRSPSIEDLNKKMCSYGRDNPTR